MVDLVGIIAAVWQKVMLARLKSRRRVIVPLEMSETAAAAAAVASVESYLTLKEMLDLHLLLFLLRRSRHLRVGALCLQELTMNACLLLCDII